MAGIQILSKEILDFDAYFQTYRNPEERQLVLVYLGAPSCGFCQDPEYKLLLNQAKTRLKEKARSLHMKLRTIGVSTDWSVAGGIAFLDEMGEWDEVSAGNNWSNTAAIEYLWNDPSAEGAIPQVVIFKRVVTLAPGKWLVSPKRYLVRLLGKPPLQQWLDAGIPMEDA